MHVGIGVPSALAGIQANDLLTWAKLADSGPFVTVAITDRIVYRNYEPIVTLAAVAAATSRVRLMTTVVIASVREPTLLAKQAATLDQVSGGRLTLGVGVGGRHDDFGATASRMEARGSRLEEQIERMKLVWAGKAISGEIGSVGPPPVQPGGPPVLIGGVEPAALTRVGQFADGYIAPASSPELARDRHQTVLNSWERHGRIGRPTIIHTAYFALGSNAQESARAYLLDYHAFRGSSAQRVVDNALTTPDRILAAIDQSSDAGADELILWPCDPNTDQVQLLAALLDVQ